MQRQLAFISEAGYIDKWSRRLDILTVTYNAAARTFGVIRITVAHTKHGVFELRGTVNAVNAAWPITTRQGARAIALPALALSLAAVSGTQALVNFARSLTCKTAPVRVLSLSACALSPFPGSTWRIQYIVHRVQRSQVPPAYHGATHSQLCTVCRTTQQRWSEQGLDA